MVIEFILQLGQKLSLVCDKKDMDKQEKCKCKEPILQPQTKQCGKCKLYIDRVRHILLTSPMKKKCSCHGACCKAILNDKYECQDKNDVSLDIQKKD